MQFGDFRRRLQQKQTRFFEKNSTDAQCQNLISTSAKCRKWSKPSEFGGVLYFGRIDWCREIKTKHNRAIAGYFYLM